LSGNADIETQLLIWSVKCEAFSYIHFSLFWVTNMAKGRESFPAFTPNYLEQN